MLAPPHPPHWGGYRLKPDSWQFWQGRRSPLHDRLRYGCSLTRHGCVSVWRPDAAKRRARHAAQWFDATQPAVVRR
jgi:hypothetical protein